MRKSIFVCAALFIALSFAACGSSATSDDDAANQSEVTSGLTFTSASDFSDAASQLVRNLITKGAIGTGTCADLETPITNDTPILSDGLDCDSDDGIVAHITPSQYALALKRVTLVSDGGADISLIEDSIILANATVVTFDTENPSANPVYIDPEDLVAGTYTGLEFEIYYFQLTFSIKGETRNVRFYMSDDDFTVQGSLGHHQGDVTFVDDNGDELGWIDGTWSDYFDTRAASGQAGAGGTDAETGHVRGFFGDTSLWNSEEQEQGATQDIYIYAVSFEDPIEIPEPDTMTEVIEITATFSAVDTFFFEDFDNPTLTQCTGFCPEPGGEASDADAAWAPLTPTALLEEDSADSFTPTAE